jgi:hypothetical protein
MILSFFTQCTRGGSEHLKYTIINRQERRIESATAKVVHDDLRLATLLVETICAAVGSLMI